MRSPLPHPGSRAELAPHLLALFPPAVDRLLEPFVGSGALTLEAAEANLAQYFVVGDDVAALVAIWQLMIERPSVLWESYERCFGGEAPDSGPQRLLHQMLTSQGTGPDDLKEGLERAHNLLRGRAGTLDGDYSLLMRAAQPEDLVYLDPPTVEQGLNQPRFREVLAAAQKRDVRFFVTTAVDLALDTRTIGGAVVQLSPALSEALA